jgi:hypothetical protein
MSRVRLNIFCRHSEGKRLSRSDQGIPLRKLKTNFQRDLSTSLSLTLFIAGWNGWMANYVGGVAASTSFGMIERIPTCAA